jgi:hypothetical protein
MTLPLHRKLLKYDKGAGRSMQFQIKSIMTISKKFVIGINKL